MSCWSTSCTARSSSDVALCCAAALKVDPQVAARKKAEQSRAESRAAQMAKQAEGTKKLTSFFMKGKK